MLTIVFSAYLLIDLAFLFWSFTWPWPASARLWILRLLLVGMIWDNLMLALGNIGVGSAWYAAASHWRFVLHAVLLPLLIPFAGAVMRTVGVAIAQRPWLPVFCWLCAGAACGYGLGHDVWGLQLAAEQVFGHARLTSVAAAPPWGTIAVNVLLLFMGWLVWRRAGWPLLLLGALFILLLNGALGAQPWGYVAGNGAEVAFILCLLLTERFVRRGGP